MSGATAPAKPGAHAVANLNMALDGAGAGSDAGKMTPDELRACALAAFEAAELPSWRRSGFWSTSFRELDGDALEHKERDAGGELPQVVRDALGDEELGALIVQIGASVVHVEIHPELAAQGVVVRPLEDALADGDPVALEHFMERLTLDRDKLEAASAAFWTGGAYVHVPKNVVTDKPIQVVYVIDEAGTAQYAHTLVVAGEHADFKLREYDLAAGPFDGQALHAGQFEMYLAAGARARLAHLQDWGAGPDGQVFDASTHVVRVARDAFCSWIPIHLGGHLTRQHLELSTAEPGSDMRNRGIYFTEGSEHFDLFTVDLHEQGPTTGDTVWHGVAAGKSRASYEGLIKIREGAQESHTYLQTHSIMLSPTAKVDSIPSLIVETDSVSASHGGTVGELDENQIFYMRTRGMSRQDAVRTIVEGFFEPIVVQLNDEQLERVVREKLAAKLERAHDDIDAYVAAR
jgi:Fe-S cluster assembly protein SufD